MPASLIRNIYRGWKRGESYWDSIGMNENLKFIGDHLPGLKVAGIDIDPLPSSPPQCTAILHSETGEYSVYSLNSNSEISGWTRYPASAGAVASFEGKLYTNSGTSWDGVNVAPTNLEYFSALMSAGLPVNIACYGDSTTDGTDTTNWVANLTVGGEAAGIAAHTTAPNAWPSKLQALLRDMHGNAFINVWNAGYSGKRLDDGWAFRNYDTAVTNNPGYGVPHVCFIAFGLNDVQSTGSQITAHATESRKLIAKLLRAGTLPVLLTCDATYRGTSNTRDHKEVSRQIDAIKIALANEFSIPLIDINLAFKNWLNENRDGQRWADLQEDGLHFGDIGHAFKAGYVATHLFRDVFFVNPAHGRQRLTTMDSRSSYVGNYADMYRLSNTAQGANVNLPDASAPLPGNSTLMKAWVWNPAPDTDLIYRGIDNEEFKGTDVSLAPKIRVTNTMTGDVTQRIPGQAGFDFSNNYRQSDHPYRIGSLPYGLSKVEYVSGPTGDVFYGNFEFFRSPKKSGLTNALRDVGVYVREFSGSGAFSDEIQESIDGINTFGLCVGDVVDIFADVILTKQTGIIYTHGSGFVPSSSDYKASVGSLIYRTNDDRLAIYIYRRVDSTGAINFSKQAESAPLTWTSGNNRRIKIRVSRSISQQVTEVFDGWQSSNIIISNVDINGALPMRNAGAVGGAYFFGDALTASGYVEIKSLSINQASL